MDPLEKCFRLLGRAAVRPDRNIFEQQISLLINRYTPETVTGDSNRFHLGRIYSRFFEQAVNACDHCIPPISRTLLVEMNGRVKSRIRYREPGDAGSILIVQD